jgi:ribosome biogenesis protein SSF1/2
MKKKKRLPNLGKLKDISDFVLRPSGDGSDSEMEDTPENRVTIEGKHNTRHLEGTPQSAVRLVEVGPRMSLELVKIQEGFCDGKVLYHSYGKVGGFSGVDLCSEKISAGD